MSSSQRTLAEPVTKTTPNQTWPEVSHNLFGQRLGRKGQETRERILTTALRLLETSQGLPITLSAVAREASVGMTTLYLYFPDLGDLMLAVLTRVTNCAGAAFNDQLQARWPNESLRDSCLSFLQAYFGFWMQHTQVIQMRNRYADSGDMRFLEYRTRTSRPLLVALIRQMDSTTEESNSPCGGIATVLMIGFDYLVGMVTSPTFLYAIQSDGIDDESGFVERLILSEAEIMALAIRQQREATA